MFVFLVFPGAFVNFVDEFEGLSHFNKLKIFCAGTWHNFVLVLVALFLSFTLTTTMIPLYSYGEGASVLYVDEVRRQ
jgi:S2P endopeptidase